MVTQTIANHFRFRAIAFTNSERAYLNNKKKNVDQNVVLNTRLYFALK